jgi:serine phosphatase RsbU (regulator of sigma subunit)
MAAPFALFFGTLNGARLESYVAAYIVSLFFAYSIALTIWLLENSVFRVFGDLEGATGRRLWMKITLYAVASLVGAFGGAFALRLTIAPTFMDSMQDVLSIGMFTLIFAALFLGIIMATVYYRKGLENAGTERELMLARQIQRSFLVSEFPRRPRVDVHAVNLSSKEVSGDFYDVVAAGEGTLLIVIADVSGKGVPAALLSSMLLGLVRLQAAGAAPSPAAAMQLLNTLACQREATGQFATLFLAAIDEPTMTLRYTNAGHNPPVLLRDGQRRLLETGGLLLGIAPDAIYEEGRVELRSGDRLVLYTDGVTEAIDARGDMLGEEGLYSLLQGLEPDLDARAIVERVLEGVKSFTGDLDLSDDVTVLAIRMLETPGDAATQAPRLELPTA